MIESVTNYVINNPRKRLHDGMKTISSADVDIAEECKTFSTLSSKYMLRPKSNRLDYDIDYFGGGKRSRITHSNMGPYREVIKCQNDTEDTDTISGECETSSDCDIMDTDRDNMQNQTLGNQYENEIDQLMSTWASTFGEEKSWACLNLKSMRQQYHQKENLSICGQKADDRKQFIKNKQREARRILMKGLLQPGGN